MTNTPLCFGQGSLILTENGETAVECLRRGDLVMTLDHGLQPITWIEEFHSHDPLIQIEVGALGPNTPHRRLSVTKNHRILVRSKIALRMFGSAEVFVFAKKLTELDGLQQHLNTGATRCYHLACGRHEIIFANGAEAETAYFGDSAREMLPQTFRPSLAVLLGLRSYALAREMPPVAKQSRMIQRHVKNQTPLIPQEPPQRQNVRGLNLAARHRRMAQQSHHI